MHWRWWAIFTVLLLVAPLALAQQLNQFSLASQLDWPGKKGFFLLLDNRYEGGPSTLKNLKLAVAVGDGNAWTIRRVSEPFELSKRYQVRFEFAGGGAKVYINGQLREQFAASFTPDGGNVFAFDQPDWARWPAEYVVVQHSLTVTAGDNHVELAGPAEFDPREYVFNPGSGQSAKIKLADPFSVEATFELTGSPDLKALSPLIDRYGQVNFATWEGKITSDEQLLAARADEERRLAQWERDLPPQDKFGGRRDLGWHETASGFFRVVERSRKWWLISPEGNPTFFTGLCNAPATTWDATPVSRREFIFENLPAADAHQAAGFGTGYWGDGKVQYFPPQAPNLITWHGEDWRDAERLLALRRVRAWGFSGMGKWTDLKDQTRLPILSREGVPNLVSHPDTFDPEIRKVFREQLLKQIAGKESDPWIIGWSLGNEMDESFSPEEVKRILAREESAPAAKRAMIDFAASTIFGGDITAMAREWKAPGETLEELQGLRLTPRRQDIEPLRLFLADQYFAFVYQSVKELAPNHLYFGHWILPTYWHNENDWKAVAPHCDVIGFDLYEYSFAQSKIQKVMAETRKPVFCGEFAFPPFWQGKRGYGRFRTAAGDENESGSLYARWVDAASVNPWCIGVSVFQYRDQPVTGRGPVGSSPPAAVHGENYAFGMVSVTNVPRWPLLEQVRRANLDAPLKRAGLTQ